MAEEGGGVTTESSATPGALSTGKFPSKTVLEAKPALGRKTEEGRLQSFKRKNFLGALG